MSFLNINGLLINGINLGKGISDIVKFIVSQTSYIKDSTTQTGFGFSVSTDESNVVIGAYRSSTLEGSAYISSVGDDYTLSSPTEITRVVQASSSTQKTWYGFSVAIDGDWLAVSAPYDNLGAVYVYKKTNGTWSSSPVQTLLPDSLNTGNITGNVFGFSISMKNNILAIGYPGYNGTYGGLAIFQQSNDTWTQLTVDNTSYSNAVRYGYSVSTDGTTVVVGGISSTTSGSTGAGAICIFKISGTVVNKITELQAPDTYAGGNNNFGYSLCVSNNIIAVGAPNISNTSGLIFLYDISGNYNQALSVGETSGNIIDENSKSTDKNGSSLSICNSGNVIISGAPGYSSNKGTVYVFENISNTWQSSGLPSSMLSPTPSETTFGTSVASSDTFIVVGAYAPGYVFSYH